MRLNGKSSEGRNGRVTRNSPNEFLTPRRRHPLILTRTPAEVDSGKRTKGNARANGSESKEDYDACIYMRALRLQKRLVTLEVWVKRHESRIYVLDTRCHDWVVYFEPYGNI